MLFFKKLKKVGHSKALIIPKAFINYAKTEDYIISFENGTLVIIPHNKEKEEKIKEVI